MTERNARHICEAIGYITLLLLMILVLFPVESVGSSGRFGEHAHFIFTFRVFKLSIPGSLAFVAFLSSILYRSSSADANRSADYCRIVPVLFCFMVLWGYLSTVQHGQELSSRNLGISWWRYSAEAILVYYSVIFLIDRIDKFQTTLYIIAILTLVSTTVALINYFAGSAIGSSVVGKVVMWENAKLKIMVWVAAMIFGIEILGIQNGPTGLRRIVCILSFLGCIVVLVLSSRRNSLIAMMLMMILILVWGFLGGKSLRSVVASVGILIALGISMLIFYDTFEQRVLHRVASVSGIYSGRLQKSDSSLEGHLNDLKLGVNQVGIDPFWGIGFDAEGAGFEDRPLGGVPSKGFRVTWVHNGLLTLWIQFGIMGAVVYVLLYGRILILHWFAYRRLNDSVVLVFFFYFGMLLLMEFFFPPFTSHFKDSFVLFGCLGLSVSYINIREREFLTR